MPDQHFLSCEVCRVSAEYIQVIYYDRALSPTKYGWRMARVAMPAFTTAGVIQAEQDDNLSGQ